MRDPRRTVFLERESYRRRRARDASRLMPVLFLFVFFIPGLWARGDEGEILLSSALIFLFVSWCIAILLAAVLARILRKPVLGQIGSDQSESGFDG